VQELGVRANRRPDVLSAAVTGRGMSLPHAPFSSVFDKQWLVHLLSRVPYFALLPRCVLYEMAARCKHTVIERGNSLASSPRSRRCLCLVVAGVERRCGRPGCCMPHVYL
jgi:hypothetical protein